jgi:hypothetical protein
LNVFISNGGRHIDRKASIHSGQIVGAAVVAQGQGVEGRAWRWFHVAKWKKGWLSVASGVSAALKRGPLHVERHTVFQLIAMLEAGIVSIGGLGGGEWDGGVVSRVKRVPQRRVLLAEPEWYCSEQIVGTGRGRWCYFFAHACFMENK